MAKQHFEVGVVYRKGKQFYLAIEKNTLLVRAKVLRRQKPVNYISARAASVEDLCKAWKCSSSFIDKLCKDYMTPKIIKPPRGRPELEDFEQWRIHKMAKI